MIQFQNVSFSYPKGKTILNHLSFSLPENGLVVILGKSGSGKTTLLSLIRKELKPTEGRIVGFDKDDISCVYQSPLLLDYLTVEENITLPLLLKGDKKKQKEKTKQVLMDVSLSGQEKKYPDQLSGGEQVRVAIARALVDNHPILILDEPTGQLDENNTTRIFSLLKKLSSNHLILLVTHDEKNGIGYADILYELKNGNLVEKVRKEIQTNHHLQSKDRNGFLSLSDGLFLNEKFLKKRKHRTFLSTLFVAFSLSLLTIGLNFRFHMNESIDTLLSSYYSYREGTISAKKTIKNSSHLSLEEYSIPEEEVLNKLEITETYPCLDYFLSGNEITIGKESATVTYRPVVAQNASLLSTGRTAQNEKEVVVNSTLLDELKLTEKEALGKKFHYERQCIIYSNKLNNADLIAIDLTFEIVGISKEEKLLNTSAVYYSYPEMYSYISGFPLENISLELGEDTSMSTLLEKEEYREDDFHSQTLLFVSDDIEKQEALQETYYPDSIKLESPKLSLKKSTVEVIDSLTTVISAFLILSLISGVALEFLTVYSLYEDNLRFFALVKTRANGKRNFVISLTSMEMNLNGLMIFFTLDFSLLFLLLINLITKKLGYPSFLYPWDFRPFLISALISVIITLISAFFPALKIRDEHIKKELEGED